MQPKAAERGRPIRKLTLDDWGGYRDLRLRALAESPDAFGSTLEREAGRPDQEWRSRLADACVSERDLPLVAEIDGDMVGLVWGRIDPSAADSAHVFQMWVAPEMRRNGLGRMLLTVVVEWAKDAETRQVCLRVTEGDTSARRLYESVGFVALGSPEPLRPGSTLFAQSMVLDLTDPSRPDHASPGHPSLKQSTTNTGV